MKKYAAIVVILALLCNLCTSCVPFIFFSALGTDSNQETIQEDFETTIEENDVFPDTSLDEIEPDPENVLQPSLESESISESEVVTENLPESESESAPEQTEMHILPKESSFSIHFIDVGQADASLVECDGHYMLIDGGNKGDSNVIYSILKKANVKKLDIVVGTHGHEDHIGGLPGAFSYTSADLTLCPVTSFDSNAFTDFQKYADQKGGGITIPKPGDQYHLGSSTVEILGLNCGNDDNNTSIVLRIDYGETSFLFTGDAERETEQFLLNNEKRLEATVLKVGHHGSESGTSYTFLREIMPDYAVISVGEGNSYGHPTDEVLSRLRDADVKTYRTDLQGDIFCTSDGKTVSFSVEKNVDADTFTSPTSPVADSKSESAPESEAKSESESESKINSEPKSESMSDSKEKNTMCWKSATGEKYHSINNCGRMNPNKATKLTVKEAKSQGLEPCSKCW